MSLSGDIKAKVEMIEMAIIKAHVDAMKDIKIDPKNEYAYIAEIRSYLPGGSRESKKIWDIVAGYALSVFDFDVIACAVYQALLRERGE